MDIKRAKQEIKDTIAAYLDKDEYGEYRIPAIRQRPVLLMGPPGIGKTQIMEQIAQECDLALVSYTITHHTRQSAIGLPFIQTRVYNGEEHSVTEYTMSEIIASVYDRMEESGKREGILFIDEINCVSETLAPTMLQFLQGKSFGNQKVPEGWIIVAAGNPPEYNRSVREFDVVTLDRVKVIPVEADYSVWKEYAYEAGIHGSILSYLDIHKENFYRMETTVDGKFFVTARGWQDLSELLCSYERLGLKADREVAVQYLQHPQVAKDFANYLELYTRYRSDYQIEEILSGTIRPGILNRLKFAAFDERLEVVGLLLSRLRENFRRAMDTDADTDRLYEAMKEYQKRSTEGETAANNSAAAAQDCAGNTPGSAGNHSEDTAAPAARWRMLREEREEVFERRLKAGQDAAELKQQYRTVLGEMKKWEIRLEKEQPEEERAWEILREEFHHQTELRSRTMASALEQLEYAFDFMEAAFGEGQEMVIFITELSVNRYAAMFLAQNECPRYYRYNKALLFEDRDAGIRRQLEEIKGLEVIT